MTVLEYNFVPSSEENGVLTVGFADTRHDTQEYLLFQKFVDPEQIEDNNGVYIERNGQQYGTYGGIKKLILSRNNARLSLTTKTAQSLETHQEVLIIFSATDEQFEQLKMDFERVLDGEVEFEVS